MAKIRSQGELQDFLDIELGWRVKEILNLKTSIGSSKSLSQSTLIRAGIALLYTHWEGFIKSSSIAYTEYVSTRGLKFLDLKPCFIVMGLKGRLDLLRASKQSPSSVDTLDFIQNKLEQTATFNLQNAINTESNLSSTVFYNITSAIGLSHAPYSSYGKLIDESLLKRRNKVAHGEYVDINVQEWKKLADEIVHIMRIFKTDIENAATLAAYRV